MKTLLLCHTALDLVNEENGGACYTAGVPMSVHTLRTSQTADIDSRRKPDFNVDLTKNISASSKLGRTRFDCITTMCCMSDVFVRPNSGIVKNAWTNIARLLIPGGHFFFTTAPRGFSDLRQFFKKRRDANPRATPIPTTKKNVLRLLGQYIETTEITSGKKRLVLQNTESVEFRAWLNEYTGLADVKPGVKKRWFDEIDVIDPSNYLVFKCVSGPKKP